MRAREADVASEALPTEGMLQEIHTHCCRVPQHPMRDYPYTARVCQRKAARTPSTLSGGLFARAAPQARSVRRVAATVAPRRKCSHVRGQPGHVVRRQRRVHLKRER